MLMRVISLQISNHGLIEFYAFLCHILKLCSVILWSWSYQSVYAYSSYFWIYLARVGFVCSMVQALLRPCLLIQPNAGESSMLCRWFEDLAYLEHLNNEQNTKHLNRVITSVFIKLTEFYSFAYVIKETYSHMYVKIRFQAFKKFQEHGNSLQAHQ